MSRMRGAASRLRPQPPQRVDDRGAAAGDSPPPGPRRRLCSARLEVDLLCVKADCQLPRGPGLGWGRVGQWRAIWLVLVQLSDRREAGAMVRVAWKKDRLSLRALAAERASDPPGRGARLPTPS